MENNEIMVNSTTGELIDDTPSTNPLDTLPTTSIDEFRRDAFRGNINQLATWAHEDGNSDAVLHAGNQLKTEDVVNHVLTIMAVQYAHVPDRDGSQKIYPVVVFSEAPSYWYNMGQLGSKLIEGWVNHVGDNPDENPYLPKLNQMLSDCGGVRVHFRWKQGKDRDYVAITVA